MLEKCYGWKAPLFVFGLQSEVASAQHVYQKYRRTYSNFRVEKVLNIFLSTYVSTSGFAPSL